jgi:hypothetical protein
MFRFVGRFRVPFIKSAIRRTLWAHVMLIRRTLPVENRHYFGRNMSHIERNLTSKWISRLEIYPAILLTLPGICPAHFATRA